LLDSHFGYYDYLQFGSIANGIRDLPAQGKLFMCGLAWETSPEVLRDVSVYLIASMLPLSHLCGPLQEALIISIPDEGEPVASFHHQLRRSLSWDFGLIFVNGL